jgi:phosphatidylserine decarboxylase
VAAPADSKPQGVWAIDSHSQLVTPGGVTIKSNTYTSIAVLIGADSAHQDAFASGTLTHTFLDVNDYHRFHTPVEGTVKEVRLISADDAVGGIISWDPKARKYLLDASSPGWQNIETRGCVILETPAYGLVALLPIGMSQVSSVNFEATIKPGATLKKGDMLGYFLFGGSDFVILFQQGVRFNLTVPPAADGTYAHVLMGEKYGELTRTPAGK